MQMYEDIVYARTRLIETVVMWQGIPVLVDDIQGKMALISKLGEGGDNISVPARDLDINPVKLGYLNEGSRALYITRTPMREDWRQGLRPRSIRAIGFADKIYEPVHECLRDTILGVYPQLSDCISFVSRKLTQSMAFSRNFAVKDDGVLTYKGKWDVGTITKKKEYNLIPKYDWVRETLEEELIAA